MHSVEGYRGFYHLFLYACARQIEYKNYLQPSTKQRQVVALINYSGNHEASQPSTELR